jgi:hypothetical protein
MWAWAKAIEAGGDGRAVLTTLLEMLADDIG